MVTLKVSTLDREDRAGVHLACHLVGICAYGRALKFKPYIQGAGREIGLLGSMQV